ncbi:ArsR family transcriptional regulator [Actinomycetospora straminea]|uniref:ArsR family transcriptional regulator n=1 Tax=Actinomycetospora straminea TaxID=663607 RepID=A0ABP9ETV5_9PSEU
MRLAAHPLRWRLMTELSAGDHRVRELAARVGEPQNLVSYHLRLLRDGGLVTSSRSSLDGRDTYYHLDLDRCGHGLHDTGVALHPALARPHDDRPFAPDRRIEVLFVCTGNSARSPIAAALLDRHALAGVSATSAGTRPKDELHPGAVRALRRGFGIDVSGQRPRGVDTLADRHFDVVVTLCDRAREVCPPFPGQQRTIHWSVRDPAAGPTGTGDDPFDGAAAEIDTRVRHLLPVLTTTGRTEGPP